MKWPDKGSRPVIPELEILVQENIYMKSHFNASENSVMVNPGLNVHCDLEPIQGLQMMNNSFGEKRNKFLRHYLIKVG